LRAIAHLYLYLLDFRRLEDLALQGNLGLEELTIPGEKFRFKSYDSTQAFWLWKLFVKMLKLSLRFFDFRCWARRWLAWLFDLGQGASTESSGQRVC